MSKWSSQLSISKSSTFGSQLKDRIKYRFHTPAQILFFLASRTSAILADRVKLNRRTMKKNSIETINIPLYRAAEENHLSDGESIKQLQNFIEEICLLSKSNGYAPSGIGVSNVLFEDEAPLVACDECETDFYAFESTEAPIGGEELIEQGCVRRGHSHQGKSLCESCLPVVDKDRFVLSIKDKLDQQ